MLLVDAHAVAIHCGKPLTPAVEGRYRQLREVAEEEIVRDAALAPGASPEKAKSLMAKYTARGMDAGEGFPSYCGTGDAPMVLRMFESMTTVENSARILAGLLVRKNPFAGDCL
jgi:hypothetical protein